MELGSLATTTYTNGTYQGSTNSIFVTRLDTDGTLDTTFGSGGTPRIPVSSGGTTYNVVGDDIAVDSSGNIDFLALATPPSGGSNTTQQWVVAQLNSSGSLNTAFGNSGIELINFGTSANPQSSLSARAMTLAPDGKIVAVGSASTSNSGGTVFAIARLNTSGSLDTSFNGTGLATVNFKVGTASAEDDTATSVVVQSDGSVVLAGSARLPTTSGSSFPFPSDQAVARLTPGGSLDTSFNGTGLVAFNENLGGTPSSDTANGVTLSGSQIVIAGPATQIIASSGSSGGTTAGDQDLTVTRLNANGSFDNTFAGSGKFVLSFTQAGTTFDTSASSVIARPSGSLLIGGSASQRTTGGSNYGAGGPSGGLLLILTPTGGLDTSFGTNGAAVIAGSSINGRMLMQADGKLDFVTSQGVARSTAPTPAAATMSIVTIGSGQQAKALGVTITFNTAVDPSLLANPNLYQIRAIKGHRLIKIRKRGVVVYNAATQTLTLNFAGKTAVGKGFQVTVVTGGIVGMNGQVLPATPIIITPTTT